MSTRFIELAGEINTAMPAYVVSKIGDALNERGKPIRGSKITLLGMAYKKDVADLRESPGLELMRLLSVKGGVISYNDPHIPQLPKEDASADLPAPRSQPLTAAHLSVQDCVVIVTNHTAYDWQFIVEHAKLIVDTRNATQDVAVGRDKIVRA